jgi:demethylmenaquinone methyltransferase/2-methoxy-6-polyprenyl-1,4-benzoquinol methylase
MTPAPHPTLRQYYASDEERQGFVNSLFDRTARHYDRINAGMSLGFGVAYRRQALARAGLRRGMRVLDVATGTGLVARAATAIVRDVHAVIGLDPSAGMLTEARRNIGLTVVQGIAEQLPFPSGRFDFVTMGYALRHVAALEPAFAEYFRVLRPGGRLLILEITKPRSRAMFTATRWYLKYVVPRFARLSTGSADAETLMRYYWETIVGCVPWETIVAALVSVGFVGTSHATAMGIFSEYRAERPAD